MSTDSVLLDTFMGVMVASVRDNQPDLTARQTATLLTVYRVDDPQTVRGLAAALKVSKPAITRALDRLAQYDLVRRRTDPTDRRSVLVQRTPHGNSYMRNLSTKLAEAEKVAEKAARGK